MIEKYVVKRRFKKFSIFCLFFDLAILDIYVYNVLPNIVLYFLAGVAFILTYIAVYRGLMRWTA